MKNYIIYKEASGEILFSGQCPDEDFSLQFIPGYLTIEGVGFYFTHYVKDATLIEYTESEKQNKRNGDNPFAAWSNQTMSWVDARPQTEILAQQEHFVKNQRRILLVESDWTDTASAPARLGQQVYQNWQTYRQALRDITTQSGYPFNVIWPTPPQG